ncbi:unnamed protein product [Ranitomeya imitator]|uniref:Transducer of regulated CREB activity N-terminal domain-containing protein n=1 Tax=Ranitomeya imitator TaxID=111125 RepID=A0ABN9MA72_9NEOB|nr:unnamed protein product [Ranitomeya imitator]
MPTGSRTPGESGEKLLERAAALTFLDPGRYETTKSKREKNRDHRACLGFSRLADSRSVDLNLKRKRNIRLTQHRVRSKSAFKLLKSLNSLRGPIRHISAFLRQIRLHFPACLAVRLHSRLLPVGGYGRAGKMAAPGASGPGSASNPRKFSEKIALQRQRQAEETAAFEEVMMDIGSTRVQKLRIGYMRGSYYGGSLPNVNQISGGSSEFQGPSPLDPRGTRHHGLVERVQHRDARRMMSPLRRHLRQMDSSPYSAPYLSPHQEASWRR